MTDRLIQGCVIRNVDFAYGIVVYTGDETKVRVKQGAHVRKRAAVESVINRSILILLAIVAGFCFLGAFGHVGWTGMVGSCDLEGTVLPRVQTTDENGEEHTYLDIREEAGFADFIEKFLTFFLLNSGFVPVSL